MHRRDPSSPKIRKNRKLFLLNKYEYHSIATYVFINFLRVIELPLQIDLSELGAYIQAWIAELQEFMHIGINMETEMKKKFKKKQKWRWHSEDIINTNKLTAISRFTREDSWGDVREKTEHERVCIS